MSRRIAFDTSGRVESPTLVLATKSGKKLGLLANIDSCEYRKVLNGPDELSFTVYRDTNGVQNMLWGKLLDFKSVWYKEIDEWFEIQVTLDDNDATRKDVTCTSLCEAELSQVNLFNVEINTEEDIAREEYTEPTVFYNEEKPEASLLNRILDKAPNYAIAHVDESLKNIQRKFSFDNNSVYDCLMDVADEVECLFIFNSNSNTDGTIARTISVYDLLNYCRDCGTRFNSGSICTKCGGNKITPGYGDDTGIVVMRENLSDSISYSTSKDSVKNCFRLEAGDDLMTATIRACNPNGSNYIWYLSDDMRSDMSDELIQKIDDYNAAYSAYQTSHNFDIDADAYNSLVSKYLSGNTGLRYIKSGGEDEDEPDTIYLENFPSVINAYYSACDFETYLRISMMPTYEIGTTTVEEEIEAIENNLTKVAISTLSSSTSLATVEVAVKSITGLYANTGVYSVKVNTTSWNNPTWVGTITLTNWGDESDAGTTGSLTVTATSDIENYAEQLIEKKISAAKNDDYDIVTLFHKTINYFADALKQYSLDCLKSFYMTCQTCVDVLIEQGCGESGSDIYESLYIPWSQKLAALTEEMDLRSSEIEVISGDNGVVTKLTKIISSTHDALDFESYIGATLWDEFIAYRREDTYSNSNYISDGLTNDKLIQNAQEFISAANKELYKSAQLQHSISASLYNLMAMKEFESLEQQFAVGNWIYVVVDGAPYKLRLTEYTIKFDDIKTIDVEFSDVTKTTNGVSDVKSILDSAADMATSYGSVTHQADLGRNANSTMNSWIADGLDATNTKLISNAQNQEMFFDEHGLLLRRYDDITEHFNPEQIKLVNTTIAFTDDNWATTKAAVGKFVFYNPKTGSMESSYGVIADTLVGNLILSEEVGIYNTSNTITMDRNGLVITSNATSSDANSTVMTVQKKVTGADGSETITPVMYLDTDGELVLTGALKVQSTSDTSLNTLNDLCDTTRLNSQIQKIAQDEAQDVYTSVSERYDDLINNLTYQLKQYQADVGQYMQFGDNGLTLGATSSEFKTVIDNRGMYFKQGGSVVAYINNNQLYIPDAVIEKTLTLGNFYFAPHSSGDGGVSLIYNK